MNDTVRVEPDGIDALMALIPGPDYPGGGQIISSVADIRLAYASGRGSLKVRACWKIEELARGQWQLIVTHLPPGTSTQKVLEEIEDLTNPKVKLGKKALSVEQVQLKTTVLGVLDAVRKRADQGMGSDPHDETRRRIRGEVDPPTRSVIG